MYFLQLRPFSHITERNEHKKTFLITLNLYKQQDKKAGVILGMLKVGRNEGKYYT
jgi:hypothetical protein